MAIYERSSVVSSWVEGKLLEQGAGASGGRFVCIQSPVTV